MLEGAVLIVESLVLETQANRLMDRVSGVRIGVDGKLESGEVGCR